MLTTFRTNFLDKFNNLSFKTKATLAAIALGTLPVVATGVISYLQIAHSSEQQTIVYEQERAESLADKVNRFMFERYGDVQTIASLPIFVNPKVSAIVSAQDKAKVLDEFIASYESYDSIAAFDLNGTPIVQSKGEPVGNQRERPYFQKVLQTNKAVISTPEISKSTGKYVVHFAAPIKNSITGQFTGVIITQVPMDRVQKLVKDFYTPSHDYHIVDRQTNKIFLSSDSAFVNKSELPEITKSRQKKIQVRYQNAVSTTQTNRAELLNATALPKLGGMPELPWTAVVTVDEREAYSELRGLMLTVLGGAIVTAGLTIGLSLLLSRGVTKFIQQMAETISKSSGDIVDTVEMQEVTVNMQANSAIETSTTVNELGAVSFQSAEQAEASAKGARQALSLAEDGTRAVQQTLQGMSGLRDKVDAIAQQIVNLSDQTGQITTVSELVADLASQTNMLALNAAVEAARAGEQGKGFSVVAGEIRKLADQSKKSADKINALADDIQTAINRTVMVTDEGTKTVNEGIDLAQSTAATFAGVTDAINNVFLNSQQISNSAKQQAVSIQAVLNSMTTISQGSQESAVGMHQVKMTTRELTQVAEELKAAVV